MARPIDLARVRAVEARLTAHLQQRPELAERTARFLAGDPAIETMERLMTEPLEEPAHLRLPREVHTRAEALAQLLAEDPELRALGRMSKTAVLRLAVLHGLEVLEQRARDKAKTKTKAPRR
jgi:anti-sigma factor RsiW